MNPDTQQTHLILTNTSLTESQHSFIKCPLHINHNILSVSPNSITSQYYGLQSNSIHHPQSLRVPLYYVLKLFRVTRKIKSVHTFALNLGLIMSLSDRPSHTTIIIIRITNPSPLSISSFLPSPIHPFPIHADFWSHLSDPFLSPCNTWRVPLSTESPCHPSLSPIFPRGSS